MKPLRIARRTGGCWRWLGQLLRGIRMICTYLSYEGGKRIGRKSEWLIKHCDHWVSRTNEHTSLLQRCCNNTSHPQTCESDHRGQRNPWGDHNEYLLEISMPTTDTSTILNQRSTLLSQTVEYSQNNRPAYEAQERLQLPSYLNNSNISTTPRDGLTPPLPR